jgi:hypothetical protein
VTIEAILRPIEELRISMTQFISQDHCLMLIWSTEMIELNSKVGIFKIKKNMPAPL